MNNLQPLGSSPTQLATAKYADVKSLLLGSRPDATTTAEPDPYLKTEEEVVKEYNSAHVLPLLLFLGVDERVKGDAVFKWKNYSGEPWFALDVTPRGGEGLEGRAKGVVEEMEKRGLMFIGGRGMTLEAGDGMLLLERIKASFRDKGVLMLCSCDLCASPRPHRLE